MLVTLVVIALLVACFTFYAEWGDWFDHIFAALFGLIFAAAAVFAVSAVTWYVLIDYTPVRGELAALNDNTGVSGSFFLGSGTIESEPVFYYYENNNGIYSLENVEAEDATIRQAAGQPHYLKHCEDGSNIPTWVFWPVNIGEPALSCDFEEITFVVPQGSITNEYLLDAQ